MNHYSKVTSHFSFHYMRAIMACLFVTAVCLSGLNPIDEPVRNVALAAENEGVHVADLAVSESEIVNDSVEPVIDIKTPEITAETEVDELNELETEAYNKEVEAEQLNADAEILAKYSYALYDDAGVRNDLTPDLLRLGERCSLEQGVDPNLFFGIVMAESRGMAGAKNKHSTATGLGQLLKSTGKWCYEDLLGAGKGTYNHSMAYDPVLNIRMTTALLGELKREYNGNMYRAVQHYRGKNDISDYLGEMNRFLGRSGLDVYSYV